MSATDRETQRCGRTGRVRGVLLRLGLGGAVLLAGGLHDRQPALGRRGGTARGGGPGARLPGRECRCALVLRAPLGSAGRRQIPVRGGICAEISVPSPLSSDFLALLRYNHPVTPDRLAAGRAG